MNVMKGPSGSKGSGVKGRGAPSTTKGGKSNKNQPQLEDFLIKRDYTGALALLEFKLKCQDGDIKDLYMWIGYCAFHLGNFKRAEEVYLQLLESYDVSKTIHLYLASCYFFQQMYEEAEREAIKGPNEPLKNRILFNVCHRIGDENKLMEYHKNLKDRKDDQLSLAAVHFLRR